MRRQTNKVKFDFRLAEILEEKKIKVKDLAEATGIEASRISDMKNKLNHFPQLNTLLIICNYLNIQINELIVIKYPKKAK